MHWYDWTSLAIIVVLTIVQTVRGVKAGGLGLPLFEAGAVVVAAVGATSFYHGVAGSLHINESVALMSLFIGFALVGLVLARWLFALTGITFQSLDGFFSFMFGLVLAWTVAHMFLRIMMTAQGINGEIAANLAGSPVSREIYEFHTWNAIMRLLFKAKLAPMLEEG